MSKQEENKKVELSQRMLDIISKSNSVKAQAAIEFEQDFKKELKKEGLGDQIIIDTQNPDKSYDLYYLIRRILMGLLPEDKAIREQVYEQKNIFLTRGHQKGPDGRRGADGRMGYIEDYEQMLEIIEDWVNNDQNPITLYMAIRDKNKALGYFEED